MPDFTAHYLFGNEVVKNLSSSDASAVNVQSNAFHWGLQGPDLLLFRKAVTGGSPLPRYSGTMHSEKSKETLLFLSDYIAGMKDERAASVMKAYFFGFLCHYCLDRVAHPFVFYKEKKLLDEKSEFGGPTALHCLTEAQIDIALYRKLRGKSVLSFPVGKEYRLDPLLEAETGKMLVALLREVYGVETSEKEIAKSFHEALSLTRLFYDPTGILKGLAVVLERLAGKKGVLSSHFKRRKAPNDILNEKHRPWGNLWYPDVTKKESFIELFESAKRDAVTLITQFSKKISGATVLLPGDLGVPFANGDCEEMPKQ